MYSAELGELEWLDVPQDLQPGNTSSYYMYHIQTSHRDELAKYLRDKGIYTTFRYYPLHWVKYFNSDVKLPNTEYAANHTLCIPLHQSLSEDDVQLIISSIKEFKS